MNPSLTKDNLQEAVINNKQILQRLHGVCFTSADLRAGWIGPGLAKTQHPEFMPLANWAIEHWKMYESFLDNKMVNSKGTILDIGCGIGYATLNLTALLPRSRITALDSDPEAIDFARKYNSHRHITYLPVDFFRFKPPHEYSYIFALEIYEHLPAALHDLFLEKCLSLLAPGGKLFLTTPNALDEQDADWGHIGMLNRARAKRFLATYEPYIKEQSFINNQELLSGNPRRYIVSAPMSSFAINPERKSHFRLVLTNDQASPHLPRFWYPRYALIRSRLALQGHLNRLRAVPSLVFRPIPSVTKSLIQKFFNRFGYTVTAIKSPTESEVGENWHVDFIVHLAAVKRPKVYVELGLYECELFNKVIPYADHLIGVDTDKRSGSFMDRSTKKTKFFYGSTADFAKELRREPLVIDLLFIDADHSKEAVLHDFQAFFPYVVDQGLIVLHDSYPKNKTYTDPKPCGDAYKAIEQLARQRDSYEMVTIPTHPGLTICRKRRTQLPW